jgi:hypothetical protein
MTGRQTSLSVETRLKLLSRLVPLGDRFFQNAEDMKAAGLTSCQPLLEFEESFCQTAEEHELSRSVTIEVAKERLGNFEPYFVNLRRPTVSRPQDQTGYLDLDLDLAQCSDRTLRPEQTIGSAPLRIGYNYAAPIDRTDWDYGTFRSSPELETLLRAHAAVYAMLHEQIEGGLLGGLQAALADT